MKTAEVKYLLGWNEA